MNSNQRRKLRGSFVKSSVSQKKNSQHKTDIPKVHLKGILPHFGPVMCQRVDIDYLGFVCGDCLQMSEHCYNCSEFHDFLVGKKTSHFLSSVRDEARRVSNLIPQKLSWWKIFTTL